MNAILAFGTKGLFEAETQQEEDKYYSDAVRQRGLE
jgi:hypothetical protein